METQTMAEKIKKYTSCIGCEMQFENAADPLILPCLHSICPVCLEKLLQENSSACPLCFEAFPATGSEQFPADHRRKMVPEFIKNKSEGFRYVLCQQCAENNVRVKCNDCDRLMCADCLKNHDKFTKGHAKIEVDALNKMAFLDTIVPLQCPVKNHQNLHLKRYCHTDQTVICEMCEITSHRSEHDHRVEAIEKVCLKKRQDLEHTITKCKDNIDVIDNQAINVQNEIDQLIQVKQRHENEIDASINNIVEWIERRRRDLKAELNDKINMLDGTFNRILKAITNAKDDLEETSIIAKYALEYVGPEDLCHIENSISNRHQVLNERVEDICKAEMPNQERLLLLPVKIMKLEELLSVNSWLSLIEYTLDVPEEIKIGDSKQNNVRIATITVNKNTHRESLKPFDVEVRNADNEEIETQVAYDVIDQCFVISSKISCTGVYTLQLLAGRNPKEEKSLRVVTDTTNALLNTGVKNYTPKERIDHMDHEEVVQRELQCPVCKEEFCFEEDKYPRLLPCLHVVGTDCVNKCVNDDQLTCPICEEIHELEDGNVNDLPRDHSRKNLSMYLKIKWSANIFHCEVHESIKALVCCQTCGQFICETCCYSHTRKGHFISTLEDLANMSISDLYGRKLCDVTGHGDKHIEFFCVPCKKLICPKCYLEQHTTCKLENYEIVYEKQLAKLKLICKRITEMKQITEELDGTVDDELKALDIVADKELEKVRCTFNNHKLALDERKRVLVSQVKGIRDGKKGVLEGQQHNLKRTGETLDESLSHALDFITFSNKITFITNFDFIKQQVQKVKETEIDTGLSEHALILFMETKGNKRFENETENLGKIWPGKIHLPNLKYTVHPVILSTECLLCSIQFMDKHDTTVSAKDIKQYIEAVLLDDKGQTVDQAITQLNIKEDAILEIKGIIHEHGKYRLMAFIANVPLRKGGVTIKTDNTEDQQHISDEADALDKQMSVETTNRIEKLSYLHTADAFSEEQLEEKLDSIDSENGQSESTDNKHMGKEDPLCKEPMADLIDRLDEKVDSVDKEPISVKGAAGGKENLIEEGGVVDKELSVEISMTDETGDGFSSPDHFISLSDSDGEEEFSVPNAEFPKKLEDSS